MRTTTAAMMTIAMLVPASALADVPDLDTRLYCSHVMAAVDGVPPPECLELQKLLRDKLAARWDSVPPAVRQHCQQEAANSRINGSSYLDLSTCVSMELEKLQNRSE